MKKSELLENIRDIGETLREIKGQQERHHTLDSLIEDILYKNDLTQDPQNQDGTREAETDHR